MAPEVDPRVRLLAAAELVMAQRGLAAFSVAEVARQAGVSSGAPYRHFASREALLLAVAQRAAQRLHEQMRAALVRAGADPVTRWVAVGQSYIASVARGGAGFDVIFAAGQTDIVPAQTELMELLLGLARDAGADTAQSAAELVAAQIALAHGYVTLLRQRNPADRERAVATACARCAAASRALALTLPRQAHPAQADRRRVEPH